MVVKQVELAQGDDVQIEGKDGNVKMMMESVGRLIEVLNQLKPRHLHNYRIFFTFLSL